MRGDSFTGRAIKLPTPEGGEVMVGLGDLKRTAESDPEPVVYIAIRDSVGGQVADFALTQGAFSVLLEGMMTAMMAAQLPGGETE